MSARREPAPDRPSRASWRLPRRSPATTPGGPAATAPSLPGSRARRRAWILVSLFRRYRLRFAAGVVLLLATNALALAIPWMVKFAVDAVHGGRPSSHVALLAAGIAAVATIQALVRTLSRVAILGASRHIVYDLRNRFFDRLVTLPAPFFDRYRTGDLMSRAVNDLLLIRSFFGPGILNLANTVLSWGGAVALMAAIDARLTLWSLIPYPFVLVAMNRLSRALYLGSTRAQEQLAALSSRAQENLSGSAQVKAYDLAGLEIAEFNGLARELRRRNLHLARVRGAVVPLMGSVGGIGTLLVLWIGSRHLVDGTLTIGEFVAFNAYLASLAWPTIAMGWILNVFQRSLGALDRISEVLDAEASHVPVLARGAAPVSLHSATASALPPSQVAPQTESIGDRAHDGGDSRPLARTHTTSAGRDPLPSESASPAPSEIRTPESGRSASSPPPQIEDSGMSPSNLATPELDVTNLGFSYDGSPGPVLRHVSFRVGPGALLGIVGPVGSGKTTIVRLLSRLYPAPDGAIRLSGVDLNRVPEAALRRTMAVVPQESFLFSMSLAENIALGRPDATRAEIEDAGRRAGLTADLEDLPRGYDTPVGERGYTLSGGQRQRVALARALLMNPVLLLLDDPFASVDAGTEEAILAELGALAARSGMTRLVTGHRVSAVQDADEILVLEAGTIVERGRHEPLLAAGGVYARLFERQRAQREIERA